MRSNGSSGGGSNHKRGDAAFQVIILGASGGPREDEVTGLLVRSTATNWTKGSVVAVDAGSHLGSIIRILEKHMPTYSKELPPEGYKNFLQEGPFTGLGFPHISARANGLYVFRELIHSFLITHPHLDHISGLGINTPGLEYGKEAKSVVALPQIIDALRTHIFNDLIWPNLSDEDNGVGFITYKRIIEGGNPRLGSDGSRGYIHVCDGLVTKCLGVSHGRCMRRSSHHRGSGPTLVGDSFSFPSRRLSRVSDDYGYITSHSHSHSHSHSNQASYVTRPPTPSQISGPDKDPSMVPVDSSAFFLRNETTGAEILIFGDTEPDTLSLQPRNHLVWDDAAPKIVSGALRAVFIECSFSDETVDSDLYGHLCPRHLIAELTTLSTKVLDHKKHSNVAPSSSAAATRLKRKRPSHQSNGTKPSVSDSTRSSSKTRAQSRSRPSRSSTRKHPSASHTENEEDSSGTSNELSNSTAVPTIDEPLEDEKKGALNGLSVYIIHVKDTLTDGPAPKDEILSQLLEWEEKVGLGCRFGVTQTGESIFI